MKIFVTVGTTTFDEMIEAVDKLGLNGITFQIAKGIYIPKSGEYFTFTDEIEQYYEQSDLIITHAGAGSIYKLLEKRKKILVVPNVSRTDSHQLQIAKYLDVNNYAFVSYHVNDIEKTFFSLDNKILTKYNKTPFFGCDFL